jgi:hypothetical protein
MAIYIDRTSRSYEDPVDSEDPGFDVYGQGPGSYIFGRDEVFYLGSRTKTCVSNCEGNRYMIFRKYDGRARDHLYTNDEEESNPSYNLEPRRGSPAFYLNRTSVSGTSLLKRYYSSSKTDTLLTTGSAPSGYTLVDNLGYIFTSQASANSYRYGGESPLELKEYYNSSVEDHLYTCYPASEKLNGYTLVGTVGWVFSGRNPIEVKRFLDTGKATYTGSSTALGINKPVAWYGLVANDPAYYQQRQAYITNPYFTPLVPEASFEYFNGPGGAVRTAVPRNLNFAQLYDAQYFYYVYDTTYPFNGPIFNTNIQVSTDWLCRTPPPGGGTPAATYVDYSYHYEIDPTVWVTQKSKIAVEYNPRKSNGEILTAGTDDKIVLIKYEANTYPLRPGDTVNGWVVQEHRYFGSELHDMGYIRISPTSLTSLGGEFNTTTTYTNQGGQFPSSFKAIAGYGIKNKAAVFGSYEFKKQISYYRHKISNKTAIPMINMDQAVIEATISNGKVTALTLINGGYGYKSPYIGIMPPDLEVTTANRDTTLAGNYDEKAKKFTGAFDSKEGEPYRKDNWSKFRQIANDSAKIEGTSTILRTATAKITSISEEGVILGVALIDGGSGYKKQSGPPKVLVWDEESDTLKTGGFGGKINSSGLTGFATSTTNTVAKYSTNTEDTSQLTSAGQLTKDGLLIADTGITSEQWVKQKVNLSDTEQDKKFKIAFSGPVAAGCFAYFSVPKTQINKALTKDLVFKNLLAIAPDMAPAIQDFIDNGLSTVDELDKFSDDMSEPYGWNNIDLYTKDAGGIGWTKNPLGNKKILPQPKLYSVKRFSDIPCPYVQNDNFFGWMPYKYCPATEDDHTFRVILDVEGDCSGSTQGAAFMNFLKTLKQPARVAPRVPGSLIKNWHCTRGVYEGRCYKDANNTVQFIPKGGDENTFDYSNITDQEIIDLWMGGSNAPGTTYNSLPGYFAATGIRYVPPSPPCTNNKPNWDGFDKYVKDTYNPNGVLLKYTGYGATGAPIQQLNACDNVLTTLAPCGAVINVINSDIAFNPKLCNINNTIRIGSFVGTARVKNYQTGSTITFARAVNNFGNPYFEVC